MLDIVQLQEYLIWMNHRSPAVLTTIIREDVFHSDALRFMEGQHPVIEDIHGGLRGLGGVKLSKGKRPIGIDDGLEPDAADPFDPADMESVLGKEISWIRALYPALPETGIGLLQKPDLLFGEVHILAVLLFLQA